MSTHPAPTAAERRSGPLPGTEGPVGWPGPARDDDHRIGWPGGLPGSSGSAATAAGSSR